MKAYTYKDDELPLDMAGRCRLGLKLPQTGDPTTADVYAVPVSLYEIRCENLAKLPYWKGNEERHYLFDCADYFKTTKSRALLVRCGLKQSMLADDPCSAGWPWPAEDFADCTELPVGGFEADVGFIGWTTPRDETPKSIESCVKAGLKGTFTMHPDFWGHIPKDSPERARRREEYKAALRTCRLALCPQSIEGVLRYRVYEAMSAARVPVIIGDDYVLPWADRIFWDGISIRIPAANVESTGEILSKWLDDHTDAEIIEAGRLGQQFWREWLNGKRWPELLVRLVRERIKPR